MSVVGRFEIVSPIFAGALDTSTARDTQSGQTVLLHLLPPGQNERPRELFQAIAADWPGAILDSGFDPETQRSFVVTEYPKDRKAFRVLIHTLSELTVPATSVASAAPLSSAQAAEPVSPAAPVASAPAAADSAAGLLAFFKAQSAPAQPSPPPDAPPAAATRMFDPSAVFGSAGASAHAAAPEPAKPGPAQDGATRMFDPSAVFGMAASAPAATPKPAPMPASDGATRMFDPSAVFGGAAPAAAKSAPPAAPDGATRMFDPSAVFGAAPPKPSAPPKPKDVSDSSKRAAEDFISGRLPPEFRDAPIKVQRSLEELLGRKAKEQPTPPTPGRPGAITLMFDAYGRRIENADSSSPADAGKPAPPAEDAGERATKMISSADLSAFFGAESTAPNSQPAKPETPGPEPPHGSPGPRK